MSANIERAVTSNVVAVRERAAVQLTNEQLKYIAHTEFVPRGLRGNLPAILACVSMGRELGIGDMAALRSINVIDGRPAFSAELMVLLVRRAGHSITGRVADGVAVAKGRRADTGDEMEAEWTMAMAERAGLAKKGNWKAYPESMLWARAVSQLCRMLFADVFAGGTYTPEELGSEHVAEHQDVEHVDEIDEADLPEALRSAPPANPGEINGKQRGRLWTIAKTKGLPEETLRDIVEAHTGQRSTHPIPVGVYDLIVQDVHEWRPPEPEEPVRVPLVDTIPEDVRASTRRKLETGE